MDLKIGRKKRQLSRFLCKEMLYDYIQGNLDQDRVAGVEEYLENDEDLQEDLEHLRSAINYCSELGQSGLEEEFLQQIHKNKSYMSQVMDQLAWRNLPDYIKWSVEAMAIAVSVAIFSIFVPWERIRDILPIDQSPEIIPIERTVIAKNENPLKDNAAETESESLEQEEKSKPENNESAVATTVENPAGKSAGSTAEETESKTQETPSAETKEDSESKVATVESNELKQIKALKASESKKISLNDKKDQKKSVIIGSKKALKGELYRAFMKLDNIDTNTSEFRERILGLGGTKAGKVRIGWRKVDGSYFHFSMDETNLEELKQFLSSYGPLRIYKDPHWRVMPEGKMRMILWVEDASYNK